MASLFSKPKVPSIKTTAMPQADDPSIRKARLRGLNAARNRSGRESTRLDKEGSSGNKLGG